MSRSVTILTWTTLELQFDSRQGQSSPLLSQNPFRLAHPASYAASFWGFLLRSYNCRITKQTMPLYL